MKLLLTLLVLAGGCSGIGPLQGIFVHNARSIYSEAYDTLDVQAPEGGVLIVNRRTGFRRLRGNQPGPLEYKTETLQFEFDAARSLYMEIKTGRVLRQERQSLRYGTAVYKKIKL